MFPLQGRGRVVFQKPSLLIQPHCRRVLAPSEMVPGTVQHLRDAGDNIQGGPGGLRAQFGSGYPPADKTTVRNGVEQKDFHGVGRL